MSEIGLTALEDTIPPGAFDSLTVAQIQSIADNGQGLATSMAQGFLNFYYGYNYRILPATSGGQQLVGKPPATMSGTTASYQPLTALPNPARDRVMFSYVLESKAPASLVVYDINGKLVKSFVLDMEEGSIDWDTDSLPHGIYYCQVTHSGKTSPSLKLVILK